MCSWHTSTEAEWGHSGHRGTVGHSGSAWVCWGTQAPQAHRCTGTPRPHRRGVTLGHPEAPSGGYRTHIHTPTGAQAQTHSHRDTQPHRHTDTETQRHRDTETQRHRDTDTQRHRDTETQRHRDTETRRHTDRHRHWDGGRGQHLVPYPPRVTVGDLGFWPFQSTCGLVAMTSASHAEGRQFDPGQVY